MEKENYIETILNSSNGITKVTPNAVLFSKIKLKINSKRTVSTSTSWLVAASIVILLMINVSVLLKKTTSNDTTTITLAASLNNSNQLY